MIVIKAGGSAITEKNKPYTLRTKVMQSVAAQLRHVSEPVILAHGVGSYGHPIAKKHRIGHGFDGKPETRLGFLYTHFWVDELSQRFVKILLDAGVPAGRLRPTSLFITEKRRIVAFFEEPLQRYLEMGIIPVLHGDGPTDRRQGYCVLSADQSVVFLAKIFQATRLIFGLDVDGVLDRGKTVSKIRYAELEKWQSRITDNQDASGGLPRKLKEISALEGIDISVQLINLTQPGLLHAAIQGEHVGTIITN